jgi:peptide/nickel transport system substrate-binding protein
MKTKVIVSSSVALMLLLLLPASILPVKSQGPDNAYVQETIGEPISADPCFQYDSASSELLRNVYEPLIFFDFTETNKFIGLIADTWSSEVCDVTDPITGLHYAQKWTFKIREGIHFQRSDAVTVPGEYDEVDVEDVEYSFERNMVTDAATGGECLIWDPLLHVGSADTEDPLFGRKIDFAVQSDPVARTVTFYLLTLFEPFLQCMAQSCGVIMSKEWSTDSILHPNNWDGVWPDWNLPSGTGSQNYTRWHKYHDPETSPLEEVDCSSYSATPHLDYVLGTGPYIFDYWDKGAGGEFKLIKNPDYWRGWSGSHIDNFVSLYLPDWDIRKADFLVGYADTVTVPSAYKDQVEGQPGIRCLKNLTQLCCLAEFFNQEISATSMYIGTIPPNGTFTPYGFPQDGFKDVKLRKAFRALFPYATFLAWAYGGEAVQPATCVVPGLPYYDPTIPLPTYNLAAAITLLKEAWGGSEASPGPVWQNGFYMCAVYCRGDYAGKKAAEMLRDELDSINAATGTQFTLVVTEVPWSAYPALLKSRVLPFYYGAWDADFPDPHNFVVPFMESNGGAFAKFQGFSNQTINNWIRQGIDATDPVQRQGNYTLLQQAYVDNCYSFAIAQPLGRRWERDWVQGWFYNALYSLNEQYVYDYWEQDAATVIRDTAATISLAQGSNGKRIVVIENTGEDTELVEYNEVISSDGTPISTLKLEVWLRPGTKHVITKNIFAAGHITITATVRITTKWIVAIGTVNPATVVAWRVGDLGTGPPPTFFAFDGYVDAFDYFLFRACYDGIAPPEAMCLGDLGSGPPATFFAFDGKVDGWDYNMFLQCYGAPPFKFDVAVTSVTLSKTVVGQGYSLNINVTAANQGGHTETFNVTVYANTTTIETREVTLTSENSTTITFTWNTTGFARGNYTIGAVADTVPGETDTADNNCPGGWILITKVGDLGSAPDDLLTFFACDGKVDGLDFALWKACYDGIAPPNAMYLGDLGTGPPPAFFACDGVIDAYDFALWKACYDGLGPDP